MIDFYVGQRVVCIDGDFPPGWCPALELPEAGKTYTVSAIEDCSAFLGPQIVAEKGSIGVRLSEIINPPLIFRTYVGLRRLVLPFAAYRFRPLVETDITVFTDMLAPTPARELEDA